jgi:hypothetical protein
VFGRGRRELVQEVHRLGLGEPEPRRERGHPVYDHQVPEGEDSQAISPEAAPRIEPTPCS